MDGVEKSNKNRVNRFDSNQEGLPLVGKKVLIVDDDEINATVIGDFAEELGASIFKAVDGYEAVRYSTESLPDFIFMDLHMPYFGGIESIQLLREKRIAVPIIALSASTRLYEKQQSIDAGATDFITKPAKREIIHEVLLKYLAK
jgi:CheY-like chemotaxis protein